MGGLLFAHVSDAQPLRGKLQRWKLHWVVYPDGSTQWSPQAAANSMLLRRIVKRLAAQCDGGAISSMFRELRDCDGKSQTAAKNRGRSLEMRRSA